MHEIDLLERVHRRVLPGVNRRDRHVRGPELGAHCPGAELGNVGHELRLVDREIHGVEPAATPDRVRDVVVPVDERDGAEDAQGLRPVILGG